MCDKPIKNLFVLILAISLIFPFKLDRTEAASNTLTKTVEFFAGQDNAIRTDGNQFSFVFSNVMIPEINPIIKSAILEINGVSYNSSGGQTINVDLKKNSDPADVGINYNLAQSVKPKSFSVKHDAFDVIDPAIPSYTLYLTGQTTAGTRSFSIFSAKLILTYQYAAYNSEVLKTTTFFIEQKINQIASGTEISKPFTIFVPEKSSPENTPLVRSVFVEISGTAKGNTAGTIEAKVAKAGFDPGYSIYNLDLASPSCGASCVTPFLVRYDASSVIADTDFPGNKDYTFSFRGTAFNTNLLNAKMIISYKYSDLSGNYPANGELISSTIDTGVDGGSAFNSIMWKGVIPSSGKVKLQIATSDSDTGPWSFLGPDLGSGCQSNTYYDNLPDTPMEIKCYSDHNNKRYFRYKAILCSNSDCVSSGPTTPEIMDVIVNWSR